MSGGDSLLKSALAVELRFAESQAWLGDAGSRRQREA
jgi:hypothetical protein